MDDMNAFERQVAGEVIRAAAPARPVDVAAVFAAIPATTQSPKWRFQTMFSATKFVIASGIVALFGGLLAAGVLIQPGEEVVPAAAASSSPQAEELAPDVLGQDIGRGGELTADIPEPNADFQAQDAIQEGGHHYFYFTTADPNDVMDEYQAALEDAGWTIIQSGEGGDPFGLFAGGAGLTAQNADGRYLTVNAGGPAGSTFIDGCVWSWKPLDDSCEQPRRVFVGAGRGDGEDTGIGASGDLTAGVPRPSDAEYQSEDAIHEGGRHFYYLSDKGHVAVWEDHMRAMQDAGWVQDDSFSGGAGGGAAYTSEDGRYLRFKTGGASGVTHFDACVWPQPPSNDHCPQNDND